MTITSTRLKPEVKKASSTELRKKVQDYKRSSEVLLMNNIELALRKPMSQK